MKCPHCNIPLMMTDRMGVEIDFCSQCRGVWLDRGELDKIIELSTSEQRSFRGARNERPREREQYYDDRPRKSYREHEHYDRRYPKYRKKKSLMGEIFDIFD